MENLKDILHKVILWMRECGEIQLSYFRSRELTSHAVMYYKLILCCVHPLTD